MRKGIDGLGAVEFSVFALCGKQRRKDEHHRNEHRHAQHLGHGCGLKRVVAEHCARALGYVVDGAAQKQSGARRFKPEKFAEDRVEDHRNRGQGRHGYDDGQKSLLS